jgi:ribose/xylose/arabinose/galactoside ABC-type transport system permease subunit
MTQTIDDQSTTPSSAMTRSRQALAGALELAIRLAALGVVFGAFALLVPGGKFVTAINIENLLMQSAVYAMCGLGMTMIIITGGIDLSAGSTIALSMVVTAMILNGGIDGTGAQLQAHPTLITSLAVLGGISSAALVGLVQGSLITGLRIVPFVVTLGGFTTIRGLTKKLAADQELNPPSHNWLFQHLMKPVQGRTFNWELFAPGVWLTIAMAIFAAAMLRYTKFGRRVYAIGSNESTARLCGVPVARTKILVYAIAGAFSGLAGVMEFSKLNIGQPTGAMSYELFVIAACVIGGTSLTGGVGRISGTMIGALIIGTLFKGVQQADWAKEDQEIVIGIIIVAAVALDQLRDRSRKRG